MCSYHLFYTVIACMISLNPHDCPFLSHVMYEEIGSRAHPRSQSWSREHRGAVKGEAKSHPMYYVLCQVWEHCFFHVVAKMGPSSKFTEWQNLTLELQSCHWVRSPLQKKKKMQFMILIPVGHYFCILCILLSKLSDYQVFGCASIRYPCIVQSYNTRIISLSQQNFHSNSIEVIHLKRKLNSWEKVLPSHIFLNSSGESLNHCLIDPFRWSMK